MSETLLLTDICSNAFKLTITEPVTVTSSSLLIVTDVALPGIKFEKPRYKLYRIISTPPFDFESVILYVILYLPAVWTCKLVLLTATFEEILVDPKVTFALLFIACPLPL